MTPQFIPIVGGPDIFRLATRLFDGSNQEQQTVTFHSAMAQEKREEQIKLDSAQREDGSGKSWNLTGFNVTRHKQVRIYYNIDTRRGTMTVG